MIHTLHPTPIAGSYGFYFDGLAKIMISLVIFIGLLVGIFARRYLQGDRIYYRFFFKLTLLIISIIAMVAADNLIILFISCALSNILLVNLMIHKSSFKAAKISGWLTAKTLLLGLGFLGVALYLLYYQTGDTSIQLIFETINKNSSILTFTLFLIMIAAMTQSAILPFHRWLISSVNSPTPVSAIMHAGLVNGGGFLLIRFSPLFYARPYLLTLLFTIGLITALAGTLWKLMQHDVKRMLACSTLAQMGFMFMQCGLGLFPAAIAHLCWHGLFKSNLFLGFNRAAFEKRFSREYFINLKSIRSILLFIKAILCGIFASILFGAIIYKQVFSNNTALILQIMVLISATQFALVLLEHLSSYQFLVTGLITSFLSLIYAIGIKIVETALKSGNLYHPLPLNLFYEIGILLLISAWIIMLFSRQKNLVEYFFHRCTPMYVKILNASQPHPRTITTHRNEYQYK